MYVQRIASKGSSGQIYKSVLVRSSKREGKKVRSITLAILTHLPAWLIDIIENAVKRGGPMDSLEQLAGPGSDFALRNAESFGAVHTVMEVAKAAGIPAALGSSFDAKLVLWQVLARVLAPTISLLAMVRLIAGTAATRLLGMDTGFNEDDLYQSGAWLAPRQEAIEVKLFRSQPAPPGGLYFYDVTSSYFEGTENELAEFGYNRDKVSGKRQVVMGLLTDSAGEPISVQLFPGNTSDLSTFKDQVDKVKVRFGQEGVTLVGDRGMIRKPQQKLANDAGLHYVSALHKNEIETLLKQGVLDMSLFDTEVSETTLEDGRRVVTRLNPIRRKEMRLVHEGFENRARLWLAEANHYLKTHPKARAATQLKEGAKRLEKGGLKAWMSLKINEADPRQLELISDAAAYEAHAKLDGCCAIVSDLKKEEADSQQLHDIYKNLSKVEGDFRTMKHGHLEIRPWYVRREDNTRAHGLTAMLALKIRRRLEQAWQPHNITVEEGLRELEKLCVMELFEKKSGVVVKRILPQPNETQALLLASANVKLPDEAPPAPVNVATRVKLEDRRKKKATS